MNPQIEKSLNRIEDGADDIAAGARGSVRGLVTSARQRGHQAAIRVAGSRKPLEDLSGIGLKISAVSHRTTDRVLKKQLELATNQLDLLALRLKKAADATGLRDLVATQLRMTPEQFRRFGQDARDALAIITAGGGEARDVIKGGLTDLTKRTRTTTRRAAPKKKSPARKKAARAKPATRRKTAKKTATRRTKKVAAKPAVKTAS